MRKLPNVTVGRASCVATRPRSRNVSGGGGIRTLGTGVTRTTVFESVAGNEHSRLFAWVSGVPGCSWERFWERAAGAWLLELVELCDRRALDRALCWRNGGKPCAVCELDGAGASCNVHFALFDRDSFAGAGLRCDAALRGERVNNAGGGGDQRGRARRFRRR